ncbi:hypothetical protein CFN78_08270 [Amycolatopsis antarctica]|uniref:Lipoprotein n=1 Tax=Amycolatopsis antarctica TaxID=1854586 RepID=A0A263D503_9PSEU|nr:hypothetical protein [Amycolatopsis antarctica]OZM73530.1 hypothetical protein CFN78_08270 [Amycolatopsis antarctica]
MGGPRGVAAIVVIGCALLSGCQVLVDGESGPSEDGLRRANAQADERRAIDEALRTLGAAGALTYRGTGQDGAALALTAGKNGTLFGALPMAGHTVRLAVASGRTFVSAPVEFWAANGSGDPAAYGGHWTGADPAELPLPPSALAPPELERTLRAAAGRRDVLAEPVRGVENGTEVFAVDTPGGGFAVTAAAPSTLTRVSGALLGASGAGELRLETPAADTLTAVRAEFEAELPALVQSVDSAASVSAFPNDNKVECAPNGSCTTTVQAGNTVGSDSTGSVRIVLRAKVSADGLGEQTCTAEAMAAPNAVVPVSCEVRFQVPARTARYQVLSVPTVTGQGISGGDVEELRRSVLADLAG